MLPIVIAIVELAGREACKNAGMVTKEVVLL